jgi:hypothetical protein
MPVNPTPAWSALLLLAWGLTAAAADCGVPTPVKGSDGAVLNGRLFPDNGPASCTVEDHGFTSLANGIARWRNGARAMPGFRRARLPALRERSERCFHQDRAFAGPQP